MLRIVQSIATIKVVDGVEFAFANARPDSNLAVLFCPDLDRYNFAVMPQGTVLAHLLHTFDQSPLRAWSEDEQDVTADFFQLRSHQIVAKTTLYPAMITLDVQIIRQDCFGYLLKEIG